MTFKIGDRVRCINPDTASEGSPKLGEVYTVVRVYRATHPESGELLLHVDTLGGWFASRFELVGRAPVKEPSPTTTPHKWAKEIHAWADGVEIEVRSTVNGRWTPWRTIANGSSPSWCTATTIEYRVKPEARPDVVKFLSVWETNPGVYTSKASPVQQEVGGQVKLTFDGETGKLKAVEILG